VALGSTFGRRLRALRMTMDMSQVELARRVGRHQTAIGPYERDEYEPPRDVVEKLAHVLETSPEYLYFGRSPQQATLQVGLLELIALRDDQMRAFRVQDDSMAPVFRPRQIALVLASATEAPSRQIGRDALVELADGRCLLRRLMPSAAPDRFDLAAYNAPLLPMVAVNTARSIVGILWPDAWREAGSPDPGKRGAITVDEKF